MAKYDVRNADEMYETTAFLNASSPKIKCYSLRTDSRIAML